MAKIRVGRVAEQIKKEISQLIQQELKDPRLGFTTVTGVESSSDLSQANIYVSVMGTDDEVKATLLALEKAKGYLRTEIGKRIRFRHTPELIFKLDQSIAYGSKIEKLLANMKDTENK